MMQVPTQAAIERHLRYSFSMQTPEKFNKGSLISIDIYFTNLRRLKEIMIIERVRRKQIKEQHYTMDLFSVGTNSSDGCR